jgi:hypothetical protein
MWSEEHILQLGSKKQVPQFITAQMHQAGNLSQSNLCKHPKILKLKPHADNCHTNDTSNHTIKTPEP